MVSELLWVGSEYQWVSMWHNVVATGPTLERSAVYLNDRGLPPIARWRPWVLVTVSILMIA